MGLAQNQSDDIRLKALDVEISVGEDDTQAGLKVGIDGEPFWRVHITPQGDILTGDGFTYPLTPYSTGGGGGGSGDVATDTIWNAAGDIVVATGADAAVRLPKGAEGTFLRAGAATVAYALLADGDIPATIARVTDVDAGLAALDGRLDTLEAISFATDAELASAVAAEAALARNADNLTSGMVADARIPAGIARDAEVAAGYQPLDSDLTTIAGQANTAFGLAWLLEESAVTARNTLGLNTLAQLDVTDVVKQTISNGVTASAPSQDVVFDALALKQDKATFPVCIGVALSDETTDITTGTAKTTIRAPFAFTLTGVRASLTTASSSGTPTVDINEGGTTLLSTKLTIDANEKTSTTAATPAVISDSAIADDAELTFDIDVAGTGAKGLKVWLLGTRSV